MPYNSETETFYQAPATVVDSTPDGDTVQEGFDDRLTPALAGVYADFNLLKADGMISVGIPATTTSRGIGRVATLADMEPGAVVENGPAFLDAETVKITTTPTPNAVPQADASGKLDAWVPGLAELENKANADLSNLKPAADDVILSKIKLRNLGTRSTTGSWTITNVAIGRPMWVTLVPTINNTVLVWLKVDSGAVIGSGVHNQPFCLGRASGWGSTNNLLIKPTATVVTLSLLGFSDNCTLYAEQI